jgi:hypothetical protein
MATGPSGWTRTTTTRVKSPACCLDTTEGMEPPRGIEPRPRPYQGRMLPLSPWRRGASGRIRTGRHRVGGPRSYRWTTLAWFGLRVSNPSLHAGDVECNLHTQAEHGPVSFTGPSTSSVVKDPALASWWAATFARTAHGGSARIRTRTRELWRLGCSRYTTLPMSAHVSKTHPPCALTWPLRGVRTKTKKAFQGIALEGHLLHECRPLRALCPPCRYPAHRYGG